MKQRSLEATVAHIDQLAIEIIRRPNPTGFVVLPRLWVVERTVTWPNRCRHLAKDRKASIASSESWMGRLLHQANDLPYYQLQL